jgi:Ca2+-dependent lipid-binding protein
VWEELFSLPVKDLDADVLHVQVMDWDRVSKDDPIGDASVALAHLVQGTMMDTTVQRRWSP